MKFRALLFTVVFAGGLHGVAACNVVTGAEGIEFTDDFGDEETDPSGSGTVSGATSGAGGAASAGSGEVAAATTAGSGGAATTTGAGPATTSAAATTGSGATTGSASTSGTTTGGGEMCGGAGPATTPLDAEEQAFVTLINNYRAQNSLGPLTPCISMSRAAQGHSEDMRDQDYFDHDNLVGEDPFDRMCLACFDLACPQIQTTMGENIAAGNSDAAATFEQWRTSPGHNANMLNGAFNFMGIGRATGGGTYGVYWTNVFAGDDETSCY